MAVKVPHSQQGSEHFQTVPRPLEDDRFGEHMSLLSGIVNHEDATLAEYEVELPLYS